MFKEYGGLCLRYRTISRYGWRTPAVLASIVVRRIHRWRARVLCGWLSMTTCGEKGDDIFLGRDMDVTPGGVLDIGDRVYIGDRSVFEIGINPVGRLRIEADAWISHDCHILAYKQVHIGRSALIGEFVSIRDSTHRFSDVAVPIKEQGDILGTITIEDGVWIGRGTLVQGKPDGIVIGKGAIVAANSVVSKSIPPFEIWGGTPARSIRGRAKGAT
jgi:acetyltransferase-like isoleucine patch superfamily enzyme